MNHPNEHTAAELAPLMLRLLLAMNKAARQPRRAQTQNDRKAA